MDEQLVFKSDKATYTARAGDDLLGGGQTAAVYRVRAEDGQVYALKWLTDAVYEQRFFQEVDWLNEFAFAPEAYGLKRNGQLLTPRVYDEQRQGERRFFVMDLAPGQPLDEVLRRRGWLPEPAALAIAAQLARVFAALHEILRRSYLDFQPRNVFWQEQSGQIMVIDWNLLSPKNRVDVAADLRSIGALLYRMVLGALPSTGGADARGRVAAHERWQEISLGVRVLLQDLLEPHPGQRIEDARTARDRLDALCQRWEKLGDDLVREAAALFKQLRNGETAATVQNAILLDVAVCLDLAGRQTSALALSNAMAMVRHNLEQEVAGRRQELTALARAISFFRSGDLETAALLFEQALADAGTPQDELQIRRWQTVLEARHNHTAGFDGAGRQRIEALLDQFQEATLAYLDRSLSPQPDLVAWRALKAEAETLRNDVAAIESLAVEASAWPVILALQTRDWSEVPGDEHTNRIDVANQAKDAIGNLSYEGCLWQVLGLGASEASVTAVDQATRMLKKAVDVEEKWQDLTDHATQGLWKEVNVNVIRELFGESEELPISAGPVFTLLNIAINKCEAEGDTVAEALFDGLATSSWIAKDDRRRAQAYEQWLHKMRRLERFVDDWNAQARAEQPTSQASATEVTPSTALDADSIGDSTTLNFPASWILSELRCLSQDETTAKSMRTRLLATVTRTVEICIRETAGLSQAELLLDHLNEEQWLAEHNEELSKRQDELKSIKLLKSIELDEKLHSMKQSIATEEAALSALLASVSEAGQLKEGVDKEIEAHRLGRMQEVEDDLNKKRMSHEKELTDLRRQIEEQSGSLKRLKAETEQQVKHLELQRTQLQAEIASLREEKGMLEKPPAIIARYEETVRVQQDKIKKLNDEINNTDRLGKIARDQIKMRDDTIAQQMKTIAELSGEKARLEKSNTELKARLDQRQIGPPSTSTVSSASSANGWKKVYEGYKEALSYVLQDVEYALDAWGMIEANEQNVHDEALLKEVRSLVNYWEPLYRSNIEKWLEANSLLVKEHYEQAITLFEELYIDGIRGNTTSNGTCRNLATAYEERVCQIVAQMNTRTEKQKEEYVQLMQTYNTKCQELAARHKDSLVEQRVKSIQNKLDPWRSYLTPKATRIKR